jgi:hypothetical protein
MRRFFGVLVFAVALSTMSGCAVRNYGRFGPPSAPPPRGEMVGRSREGRVWIPGYNRWTGNRYRWVEGRWVMPPRHGVVWVPGHRATRRGGYVWVEGYWR